MNLTNSQFKYNMRERDLHVVTFKGIVFTNITSYNRTIIFMLALPMIIQAEHCFN